MNRYCFPKFALIVLLFANLACENEAPQRILSLGHAYDWQQGDRVDPRLEALDFSKFDQIWLAGDVCSRTTESPATLDYLDTLFQLRSERLHWAWGNHDVLFGNTENIIKHTGKPDFYARWQNGFCLLVLNTNLFWYYADVPRQENCEAKAAQLALLKSVTDTIHDASHLVILHHHALFNELKKAAPDQPADAFNGNAIPIRATCDSTSDLTKTAWPWLQQVQQRGVQVVLVGGDLGMRAKTFEQQTPEGIWMLGSGINNSVVTSFAPDYVSSFAPDQVLVLNYWRSKRKLDWSFQSLQTLLSEAEN